MTHDKHKIIHIAIKAIKIFPKYAGFYLAFKAEAIKLKIAGLIVWHKFVYNYHALTILPVSSLETVFSIIVTAVA